MKLAICVLLLVGTGLIAAKHNKKHKAKSEYSDLNDNELSNLDAVSWPHPEHINDFKPPQTFAGSEDDQVSSSVDVENGGEGKLHGKAKKRSHRKSL